ncbi:cytidine deaminase [Halodesulfurarchaeum formicicum]|uniref:cytidine deaminase n=1 Tax=Halodesulfurarchaeum formicicum TaxID=1873524 RepID=A0A1D8S3P2_9EURY|nr:cytidine deaminase [Halodesulfurarchaeum formicicum]AOW79974.1 cytidine deaminase [Halodesulfurarchaeum formicicum]
MDELLNAAREAVSKAYVPYSEYAVGAAIETTAGAIYTGANLEVSNYSNSLHAEEVALSRALMDGHEEFERIAVSAEAADGPTPCGMCRQTLSEFAGPDFVVVVDAQDGPETYRLGELLPHAFSGANLGVD